MIDNGGNGEDIILGLKGREKLKNDYILSIGRAISRDNEEVKVNSANPHVVFVCGTRGSGKSYTLGVLAEEIAETNKGLATVIVDPIGVFWSIKYPNQEKREIEMLKKFGLEPEGIDKAKIFVPRGYKSNIPDETYDTYFSFRASSLKPDDWCLTFEIDRYSPQGLALERAIEKVQEGYTRGLGDERGGTRDVSPNDNFTIEDLIECINQHT